MEASRAVTAIVLGAALLLTGCSGPSGAEATAPTPAASTPAPTPSPSPSPSPTPEPAPTPGPDFERTDEVGAQAAAVYAIDVIIYTVETGDTSILDELELPGGCKYCDAARRVMRDWHSRAHSVQAGPATVGILKSYPRDATADGYPLDIRISEPDALLLDADGAVIETSPASVDNYRIELRHDGTTWRLINVLNLKDIK